MTDREDIDLQSKVSEVCFWSATYLVILFSPSASKGFLSISSYFGEDKHREGRIQLMVYSYDLEVQNSSHIVTDKTSVRCISVAFQLCLKSLSSVKKQQSSPALSNKLPR